MCDGSQGGFPASTGRSTRGWVAGALKEVEDRGTRDPWGPRSRRPDPGPLSPPRVHPAAPEASTCVRRARPDPPARDGQYLNVL